VLSNGDIPLHNPVADQMCDQVTDLVCDLLVRASSLLAS